MELLCHHFRMEPGNGQRRGELQYRVSELDEQVSLDGQMIAYLVDEHSDDQLAIESRQSALVTSRRIGTALGIIMATENVTDDQAFQLLRTLSQPGRPLRDVADDVIRSGSIDGAARPRRPQ